MTQHERAHLCDWTCRILCALGNHVRPHGSDKCRCCLAVDHSENSKRAQTTDWDWLSSGWRNEDPETGHTA